MTLRSLSLSILASASLFAQEDALKNRGEIPKDLLGDPHFREELGINHFTAPSIQRIFEDLEQLAPLPVDKIKHELPDRMPLDRANLAIEIGYLIAEGFLAVQNSNMEAIPELAKELNRYGKALGAGERVNRHAASLLDNAKQKNIEQLKAELAATQQDVEIELVLLRDADLAHLISFGGWIRALEVAALAVEQDFSEETAGQLFREDVADYYEFSLQSLDPRVAKREEFVSMRRMTSILRQAMSIPEDQEPTEAAVKTISETAQQLAKAALTRH